MARNMSVINDNLRPVFLAWLRLENHELLDEYNDAVANDELECLWNGPGHFREYFRAYCAGAQHAS